MRKIALTVFLIAAVSGMLLAQQNYRWKATLADSVAADGFYNIVVTPEIGAKLQDGYADIRIVDESNQEVPFIQKTEEANFSDTRFKEYPIVSNEIIDKCCTKLTIKNPAKKPINNICFVLKNSDAVKVYQILGSDDSINWFAVKQFDVFYNQYSETDTKVVSYVNFPLTDYLYYRFDLTDRGYWDETRWNFWHQDRWSYPVNVLKAGYYETYLKEGIYQSVPAPAIAQKDSAAVKTSFIKISFADNYIINRIRFHVTGPRYYKRSVTIARKETDVQRNKIYYNPIGTIELNSYSLNEFDFSFFREKEFYLIIENNDNRPLKVEQAEAWQLTRYLKTYLEKGQRYALIYSDSADTAPVYDLQYFADSIPVILPTLAVEKTDRHVPPLKEIMIDNHTSWYESKLVVWLSIIGLIAILSFMSWKMLNEMKKK
jgi:hypothetical protein